MVAGENPRPPALNDNPVGEFIVLLVDIGAYRVKPLSLVQVLSFN